jgi:flagellar protein FlaG
MLKPVNSTADGCPSPYWHAARILRGGKVNIQPKNNISQPAGSPPSASGVAAPAAPARPAKAAAPAGTDATAEQLARAVAAVNKSLDSRKQAVEFSIDDVDKRPIIKVVDQQTKEVIRQIPSEEMLEIARALDKAQGLLIDHKA